MAVDAVIFDLDNVLVDTEELWSKAREQVTRETGGTWREDATRQMMGMSSVEWSQYMRDELGVPLAPEEISRVVVDRMRDVYRSDLRLMPGARGAVERIGARWPLGLASSSNRPLIELALELTGLADAFAATVSSEEVERGKPEPDVYLEAARRLDAGPSRSAAVEDSTNGLLSARNAGMRVIAVPHPAYPPEPHALAVADVTLQSLDELTPAVVEG